MPRAVLRIGGAIKRLRGINRRLDTASIPPDQFRDLQNVDYIDGLWVSRGGQSGAVEGLAGMVTGIFAPEYELTDDLTAGTLFHSGTATGIAGGNGVVWKRQLGSPSGLVYYNTTLAASIDDIAIRDSNTIFVTARIGGDTKLYELTLEPSADPVSGARQVAAATLRGSITQGTVQSSSCCLLGTDVYVTHGATLSADARTYKWNGATFTSVDSPAIAGALLVRPTHDDGLLVLHEGAVLGSSNGVRKMTSAGVWSSISAENNYLAFEVAIFQGATYISGLVNNDTHDCALMKYDGTTYTTFDLIGGVDLKVCMALAQGKLWFASTGTLSSFDGSSLTIPEVDFSATGQDQHFGEVHGLEAVGDSLAMMVEGTIAGHYNILRSPGADFGGVWLLDFTDTLDESDSPPTLERLRALVGV